MKFDKLIIIATITLASPLAFAGYAQPAPVQITVNEDLSGSASGDLLTARTSKAKIEDPETGKKYEPTSIGCGIKAFAPEYFGTTEVVWYGFCQATNDEGDYVNCFTENGDLLDAMKAVADRSYLRFDWNADAECTRIDVSTQSFYLEDGLKGNKAPD